MQIVHLTASALYGGPERQMMGLAAALPAGIRSSFLTFREAGRCKPFLNAIDRAGLDGYELVNDSPKIRASIREVTAFLQAKKADVLIAHGYKSNILGRPAARRAGIPIVSVARGWTGENWKVRGYETLDRFHLKFMDRVVCVSRAQAGKVLKTGINHSKVRVIRNAARLDAFLDADPADRRTLHELAGGPGPIVLAAGRLSIEKGFAVLVEAAAQVKHPGAKIVIFGEGPERGTIERRLGELNLHDRVKLLGFHEQLDRFIPWADLVVLPSFTEGLPNVPLEAAAAGRPVVATAVGGTPEVVVDGETGLLVPPGQPVVMAEAINRLLGDPAMRTTMGEAAREHVSMHFSFEAQAKAYVRLFRELTVRDCPGREPVCV
jgi:glycosyltransferase involved in cell wall biosynthesis